VLLIGAPTREESEAPFRSVGERCGHTRKSQLTF
jgi:hypothetical protein